MNFYESEILRLQNRIEKIEQNPDPNKLKTNKMRYELDLELAKEKLRAWQEGKPFAAAGFVEGTLVRAMGFTAAQGDIFAMKKASDYLDLARIKGLPVDSSCDMTSVPFAMECTGEIASEDLFLCNQHACTPMWLSGVYMSHTNKQFSHYLDIGFENNEDNLKHVTDQIREFIEVIEKRFPGIKYNEDRLMELQEINETAQSYIFEMYQMRKHKPSPIAGKDAFLTNINPVGYPDPKKALNYLKARRDEMGERMEKGIAGVPGEKLRLLWTVTRPFFMDPFAVLEKRKAAVILHYSGPVGSIVPLPKPAYLNNRKLKPLEKVAAHAISSLWKGPGSQWIENMVWVCRDLQIDAVINYCMRGCTATLGLRKLVEDALQANLSIPTLQLEGSQWDPNYNGEQSIIAKLDEFAQVCIENKNLQN